MTTSSANNSFFRSFFEKQKLTGPNFIDWYQQLRIVQSIEDKLNYLEQPLPSAPVAPEGQQVAPEIIAAYTAWIKGSKEIIGLMLITMEPEIQQNLENLHANDMLKELKTLFAQQAEQELLHTTRDFHSCKQEEGQSVSSYILKMKGYIDNLERLGHPVTLGLAVSLILIGLRKEFDRFVQNYNMHSLGKTVNELHAMLKLHEQTLNLPKNNAPALHAIRAGKVQKDKKHKKPQPQIAARGQNQGNGKNKHAYAPKPKIPPPPMCRITICTAWGRQLMMNNKHKKPQPQLAVRGQNQGKGKNKLTYASKPKIPPPPKREDPAKDSIYHECGETVHIPRDGIFEIDLSNSYANDSSMYVVSNKRAKLDLDSALLWHCRLGHISKKRIEKLQHDRLLNSTDLRAFEKYVYCMSEKMARKPYTHQVERAKDLLGLYTTEQRSPGLVDFLLTTKPLVVVALQKKADMDGAVHTYKAHFVAKGFIQTYGVNYEETFSPIADIRAIRILIAITTCFALKDLGEAAYILEIKIYRDRSRQLIDKLRLGKSQGASTPAELKRMQNVPYTSVVGSIMYVVRCISLMCVRSYITSDFNTDPGDLHWTTVKNILKYLKNTKDMLLVYRGGIDWKSAKQSIFATSSAESEYIAAYDASKEAV
ncbi:zinc finger, CCHC-type containing protein [Tanacetum coccineum]